MTTEPEAAETFGANDEMSAERADALWKRVEEALDRPENRSRTRGAVFRGLFAAAALLAAAGGAWLGRESAVLSPALEKASSLATGTELRTEGEPFSVELADGSKLDVAPRSKMAIARADRTQIELRLTEGTVECEVAKDPNRLFVVNAGGASVRVIGTRFRVARRVSLDGETIEVQVVEGVVEVTRTGQAGATVEIRAGESWSSTGTPAPSRDVVGKAVGAEKAAVGDGEPSIPNPGPQASRRGPQNHAPDARALFERAGQLRRSGDLRGASEAYDELVRSASGDSRAALAAFESARLKMDALADGAGALRSLEKALSLSPRASFREDALARLVKLEARFGGNRCAAKRDGYVAEYPSGVHRAEVERVCPR